MRKCEPNQCKHSVVGFAWIRLSNGVWKHNMIRECFNCRSRVSEDIHYVDSNLPMCSQCFGQDIELVVTKEKSVSKCTRCEGTDIWHLEVADDSLLEDDYEYEEDEYDEDDDDHQGV